MFLFLIDEINDRGEARGTVHTGLDLCECIHVYGYESTIGMYKRMLVYECPFRGETYLRGNH